MTIAAGKRKRLQTGHCYMFADAPQWQCGQRKEHPGEWVLVKLTPRSKKLGVAQVIANVPPHDVVCVMAYESNPERFLCLAVERKAPRQNPRRRREATSCAFWGKPALGICPSIKWLRTVEIGWTKAQHARQSAKSWWCCGCHCRMRGIGE